MRLKTKIKETGLVISFKPVILPLHPPIGVKIIPEFWVFNIFPDIFFYTSVIVETCRRNVIWDKIGLH